MGRLIDHHSHYYLFSLWHGWYSLLSTEQTSHSIHYCLSSLYDIADAPDWIDNRHHIQLMFACSRYHIADAPGWVHNMHHIQFSITCSRYGIADAPNWVHSGHYYLFPLRHIWCKILPTVFTFFYSIDPSLPLPSVLFCIGIYLIYPYHWWRISIFIQ